MYVCYIKIKQLFYLVDSVRLYAKLSTKPGGVVLLAGMLLELSLKKIKYSGKYSQKAEFCQKWSKWLKM